MITVRRISPDATALSISVRAHELMADMSVVEGGTDAGPTPHDLYDAALGACKALTVLWYARREGIAVDGVDVLVSRDASEERRGRYRLTTRLALSGAFSADEHDRLIAAAAKCPVHKLMTEVTTEIETLAADRTGFRDGD